MPLYFYKARDRDGRFFSGNQEAQDEETAVRALQSKGFLVTHIEAGLSAAAVRKAAGGPKRHRRVKGSDLLLFAQELATLLNSGVNLVRALDIVSGQIQSDRFLSALEDIQQDIRSGLTFKDAIQRHPKVFPPLWGFIIEAGEVSGNLSGVLLSLAKNLETTEDIKKKVVTALIYPAVLIGVAIFAIAVFMLKIIPVFADLYRDFDAQLPYLTRIVMGLSEFMARYFLLMAAGVALVVFLFRRWVVTPLGQATFDRLVIRLPVLGAFIRDAVLARVAINLSTLIKSGVDFLNAIEIAARTSGNHVFRSALVRVRDDLQEGATLSEAVNKHSIFASIMVQMIQVGEETGRLDEMMMKIGEYYDQKVGLFINRLSTLIEPVILLGVGSVIAVLVVAMFLPIFTMSTIVK